MWELEPYEPPSKCRPVRTRVATNSLHVDSVVKFHNQTLRFILLPPASNPASLFPILDGCAAADFVIVGLSSQQEVDANGETALRCLTGSGIGASGGVVGVVQVCLTSSSSMLYD